MNPPSDEGVQCRYGPWTIYPDGTLISNVTGNPKKAFKHKSGYLNVTYSEGRKGYQKTHNYQLHRLVAEHFIGPIPDDKEVDFKDGNKENVHVDNLQIVTRVENVQHDFKLGKRGGRQIGSKNTMAKINDEIAELLVRDILRGDKDRVIAERYSLRMDYVQNFRHKKRWEHVWKKFE